MKPQVKEEHHELTVDAGSRRSSRRANYIQRDIEKEFDRFLRTHEGEDEELTATDFAFMSTLQDLLHYAEERSRTMNNRLAYKLVIAFCDFCDLLSHPFYRSSKLWGYNE